MADAAFDEIDHMTVLEWRDPWVGDDRGRSDACGTVTEPEVPGWR